MIGDKHNLCSRNIFSIVATISITAMVSISAMVATIAMVMVSSIVMTIPMPVTMTIAVVTIAMTISTIAVVVIAWRRFQVFDNLHFFVLLIFGQLHTVLNSFRLSMPALCLRIHGRNSKKGEGNEGS